MGTWGTNAFEDDTALEVYDNYCENLTDLNQIEADLDTVIGKNYNMDDMDLIMAGFDEPIKVLVASEIIAATLGNQSEKFPDNSYHTEMEIPTLPLANLKLTLNETLRSKAKLALDKIKNTKGIHLTELWMESDSYEMWKQEIDDLIKRIS